MVLITYYYKRIDGVPPLLQNHFGDFLYDVAESATAWIDKVQQRGDKYVLINVLPISDEKVEEYTKTLNPPLIGVL